MNADVQNVQAERELPKKVKLEIFNIEGDNYLLLNEFVNTFTKLKMIHNVSECGHIFEVDYYKFFDREQRCPVCGKGMSKGEKRIDKYLKESSIISIPQYKFKDCKDINLLRFDFAIFDDENNLSYLIEYDGKQHFEHVNFGGISDEEAKENFIITKRHDRIKNTYCTNNDISLYRIPYWKFNEIEQILNKLIHNEEVLVDGNFIVQ